jgi:hypothetical protein
VLGAQSIAVCVTESFGSVDTGSSWISSGNSMILKKVKI